MDTSKTSSNSYSVSDLVQIVVALVAWTLISLYAYQNGAKWFMPTAASQEAEAVDELFRWMLGIGTFVFLLTQTLLWYFVIRYGFMRDKNDDSDGPHIHGNNTLELIWTIVPSIIVFFLTVYSFQVLIDTTEAKDNEFPIEVTARRFFWEFKYPNLVDDTELSSQHVLVLPVNEPIRLEMDSLDVIHAFWVPEFRVKNDVMPGRTTQLRFTPTKTTGLPDDFELVTLDDLDIPGPDDVCPEESATMSASAAAPADTAAESAGGDQPPVDYEIGYDVVCAELCGGNHGLMRGEVFVVEREVYDAYVESLRARSIQAKAINEQATRCGGQAVLEAGRGIFAQYGCNTCHILTDAGALNAIQGPSLDGIGSRAANQVGYADAQDYIRSSIINPNAFIVDGYPAGLMPQNFVDQMSPEELNLIVAYLSLMTDN